MKAIILAAGTGSRLSKYTKNLPKCLLEFKGLSLLERGVKTLRECGIGDISVVKGYMTDKIQIPKVKYYINPDYLETNMVETLFCAEKEIEGDLLVVYADIIYEKKVIKKILDSKFDIGVTVDDDYWPYWQARLKKPEDDIESLVIDSEDKIIDLGREGCSRSEAKVRYVGLIKFSRRGAETLKKVYHKNRKKYFNDPGPWMRSKSFRKAHMTCMLQALINEGYRVDPIHISHGWTEFDTNEDYEKAIFWDKKKILKKFINL